MTLQHPQNCVHRCRNTNTKFTVSPFKRRKTYRTERAHSLLQPTANQSTNPKKYMTSISLERCYMLTFNYKKWQNNIIRKFHRWLTVHPSSWGRGLALVFSVAISSARNLTISESPETSLNDNIFSVQYQPHFPGVSPKLSRNLCTNNNLTKYQAKNCRGCEWIFNSENKYTIYQTEMYYKAR